jgi:hypothetical protein
MDSIQINVRHYSVFVVTPIRVCPTWEDIGYVQTCIVNINWNINKNYDYFTLYIIIILKISCEMTKKYQTKWTHTHTYIYKYFISVQYYLVK